jgi:hypothetical protein
MELKPHNTLARELHILLHQIQILFWVKKFFILMVKVLKKEWSTRELHWMVHRIPFAEVIHLSWSLSVAIFSSQQSQISATFPLPHLIIAVKLLLVYPRKKPSSLLAQEPLVHPNKNSSAGTIVCTICRSCVSSN